MAKSGKRAQHGRATPSVASPAIVTALVERLRDLPADAGADDVRAAVGADEAAVPAAAQALAQADDEAPLLALVAVPAYAAAAVPALGAAPSATAGHALERIAAVASDRATAKAARRALHALASQGLRVHTPLPAGEAAVYQAPHEEGIVWERALAGPFDEAGLRSLLLAQARQPSGSAIALAVISEDEGVLLFQTAHRTLRQLEKEWQAYHDHETEIMLQPAPFGYVQWLLSEAADLTTSRGNELSEEYSAWREITGGPPPGMTPKIIYDEVGVDPSAPPSGALMRSAQLLSQPEIEPWAVPMESLGAYTGEWLSAQSSQIVLSESAQQSRERQIVARAVDAYFVGDVRERYKRRLEETALIFVNSDRQSEAEAALAAAIVLGDASSSPSEVPLLIAMVLRALTQAAEIAAPTSEEGQAARTQLYGITR